MPVGTDLITPPTTTVFAWADEEATRAFAQRLAARPGLDRAFIALEGDLGAGKTSFVRHLLRALGATGRIKSPTYAVLEPYELAGLAAYHFDFYRFGDPREWADAGFRDIFGGPGLKLVEWPQRAGELLPVPDLLLHIEALDESRRRVSATAHTRLGLELLG